MSEDEFAPLAGARALSLDLQLETASIEDLEARIVRLRDEISACEKAISAKRAQRAAADSLFSSRGA